MGKSLKKIWVYILASFGFSWLMWLPMAINRQLGTAIPLLPYQFYLASLGPLAGAAIASLAIDGRQGLVQWGRRAFSLGFPKKWLLIAVGMPIIYGIIAIPAHFLVTGSWPELSRFGLTEKLPGFNIWQTALVWMLSFGLCEEAGWRGFLLPELSKRHPLIKSSLGVAVIWMLWHLPAFFFNPGYMGMGFGIIGWVISLAYGSVLLAWICKGSSWSIIPVMLWHAGFDLITASDQAAAVMAAVCSMLVIIHGIFLSRKLAINDKEVLS